MAKSKKHKLTSTFSNLEKLNKKTVTLIEKSNSWITVGQNIKFLENGKIIGELEFLDVGIKNHKIKVVKVCQGSEILFK